MVRAAPREHGFGLGGNGISAQAIGMSDQVISEIKVLLVTDELPSLGPRPRAGVIPEAMLNDKLDLLFSKTRFTPHRQQLIRALLLLWHDHLDASHTISQDIETSDGSFVHAIMHRREPDYWNAKYWWRRVGLHRTFPEIGLRITESLLARGAEDLVAQLLPDGGWHPEVFVDLCEQAARSSRNVDLLREVQRIETEVLLEQFLSGDPSK